MNNLNISLYKILILLKLSGYKLLANIFDNNLKNNPNLEYKNNKFQ